MIEEIKRDLITVYESSGAFPLFMTSLFLIAVLTALGVLFIMFITLFSTVFGWTVPVVLVTLFGSAAVVTKLIIRVSNEERMKNDA